MIQPTTPTRRVSAERLQRFAYDAARTLTIPEEQARLLSNLLVSSDLRGVLSHGTWQLRRYMREIRTGGINPQPELRVVRETPNSLLIDGDGGLGYFPAYEGTLRTIEKANQHGMAVLVTRNHGHIGAAGHYTRLTLASDLMAFCTSGVQLALDPSDPVYMAGGGSPMSFSAPAGEEPALVLDAGVMHDLQGKNPPRRAELERISSGLVLRCLGMGTVCQAWGGLLSGIPIDPARAGRRFDDADQGAMLFAFRISLFADPGQFKQEMDEYVRRVRQLQPIAGTEGAFLPGGVEAEREKAYRVEGVPLSQDHENALRKVSEELGVALPWD